MTKKIIAYVISILFLPFFLPILLSFYIIYANPYAFPDPQTNKTVLGIVALLTIAFPAITVVLMYALKFIRSLELRDRQERIIPYVASGAYYIWAYYVFYREGFNDTVAFILLGATISIFLALLVNVLAFKVSMHTTGAGGMIAATMLFINITYFNPLWFFIAAIIAAGAVGTSRLILKAHSEQEVYFGYLLGFLSFMVAHLFFPF